MLARREKQPLSLFDSFFTGFPKAWDTPDTYNRDYEKTYNVAGYSKEELNAMANPKINRLTITSEDDRVYYTMTLPSSQYDVTQANIEVKNGLMRIHIPLLETEEESVPLTIY